MNADRDPGDEDDHQGGLRPILLALRTALESDEVSNPATLHAEMRRRLNLPPASIDREAFMAASQRLAEERGC